MRTTKSPEQRLPFPKALEKRLLFQFGPALQEEVAKGFNAKRLTTFRTNTLKATDNDVMDFFRKHNITYARFKTIPHAFTFTKIGDKEALELELCKEGKIYLQGPSSMLPPLVLDPHPGEVVLDLCAAPGSKTSQMAGMMKGQGQLVAMEKDTVRFQKLRNTMRIQGADFVETLRGDANKQCANFVNTFDKILADVPCSAEGRIAFSDPRSYGFWSEKNIAEHVLQQRALLSSAIPCLKPGGVLVYSTCTLAPEENEENVRWMLQTFPQLKIASFDPVLDAHLVPEGAYYLPSKEHEGMFVAKLEHVPL